MNDNYFEFGDLDDKYFQYNKYVNIIRSYTPTTLVFEKIETELNESGINICDITPYSSGWFSISSIEDYCNNNTVFSVEECPGVFEISEGMSGNILLIFSGNKVGEFNANDIDGIIYKILSICMIMIG